MEGILNEQSLHAVGKEKKKENSNKKVSSPSPLNSLSQELDEGAQERKEKSEFFHRRTDGGEATASWHKKTGKGNDGEVLAQL